MNMPPQSRSGPKYRAVFKGGERAIYLADWNVRIATLSSDVTQLHAEQMVAALNAPTSESGARIAITLDDLQAECNCDAETKQKVFDRLIAYFKEHQSFTGESLCQMDGPQLDAMNVLSDIADDILKFKVIYK